MIDVRRGAQRFRTAAAGIESWHSFSYGAHYDPDNLAFASLMAHNEDRLDPGAGYDRHAHRGVDIVTWVIGGTLEHEHWVDDLPPERERLTAGCLQVLRTGGGVQHAERAAAGSRVAGHGDDGSRPDESEADASGVDASGVEGSGSDRSGAHYVQMWLRSGRPEARPDYARRDATADLAEPDRDGSVHLVTVASGRTAVGGALALSTPNAELSVARLPAGTQVDLARPARDATVSAHLFVTRGVLRLDDGPTLAADDALRLQGELPTLTAQGPAEILLWRFTG